MGTGERWVMEGELEPREVEGQKQLETVPGGSPQDEGRGPSGAQTPGEMGAGWEE